MSRTAIAPDKALERAVQPWLFMAVLLTGGPHVQHQPLWLSLVSGVILLWVTWAWWRARPLPHKGWLMLLVGLACGGILWQFHTLFGRDAGVAMLVLFMALKLLELRTRRDARVLLLLGYFLLLTHYLYSQSISTGLMLLLALLGITAALIRLQGGPVCTPRRTVRLAAVLMAQALPFMLVLYLLFPRISGPLWGMPEDAYAGMTGLSGQMSPGTLGQLVQNGSIAFRARFSTALPPKSERYWRGPVLENYNGRTWQVSQIPHLPAQIESTGPLYAYTLTLEAHNQHWLLALDAPVSLPEQGVLAPTLEVLSKQPVRERQHVTLQSRIPYRFNVGEAETVLRLNLHLPAGYNPRTLALARQWRDETPEADALIRRALRLFRDEAFVYTLRPPRLGENAMDEFLFNTRRGFCEHYASAFVVLMRAAGVPARVVTGYQGGDMNPVDGHVTVRQSDAHAWAEVWLAGQGWVRVDPTGAISPARIEQGLAQALPAGEPLPALMQLDQDWLRTLRYRWEALNNGWNQWILGYGPEKQQEVLRRLGMHEPDWRSMARWLGIGIGSLLLVGLGGLFWWQWWQYRQTDPALRLWQQTLKHLARHGATIAPGETPQAFVRRLHQQQPRLPEKCLLQLDAIVLALYHVRYGMISADPDARSRLYQDLNQAVRQLGR